MKLQLPSIADLEIKGKKVLVRVDLDYKEQATINKRQEVLLPTLEYLVDKASRVILLGHRGRPGGKTVESLSLKSAGKQLEEFLKEKWGEEKVAKLNMYVMENLRFNSGEEANDEHHAEHLAEEGDVYINEAFATSHRKHASIVALPLQFKTKSKNLVAAGFHFITEVENLSRVFENPKRPVLVIISGVKRDKLDYINDFEKFADRILVGGRLPDLVENSKFKIQNENPKFKIAELTPGLSDIDEASIQMFEKEISKAGTIVVSGPMGKFENEAHRHGTERVLKAVAASKAFKVAGGGDTERAISMLGLQSKFDWISVGGGAMLEFLAKGTLPGIQALLN